MNKLHIMLLCSALSVTQVSWTSEEEQVEIKEHQDLIDFFEQRGIKSSNMDNEPIVNIKIYQSIIESAETLLEDTPPPSDVQAKYNELRMKWRGNSRSDFWSLPFYCNAGELASQKIGEVKVKHNLTTPVEDHSGTSRP